MVLCVSAACACSPPATSPAQSWVGRWTQAGTASDSCVTSPGALGGTATISIAAAADTFQLAGDAPGDLCDLTWSPTGSTATVVPGQTCTLALGGTTVTFSVADGTATLSAAQTIKGSVDGDADGGCAVTEMFTLARITPPPPMK